MNTKVDPLALLRIYLPDFENVVEQRIDGENSETIGWSVHIRRTNGEIISSGTHQDRNTARRIAVAECLERKVVENLAADSELSRMFALDLVCSTSGFAAGFESSTTRFRAICEGLERWAWSQWIDEKYLVQEVEVDEQQLSPLARRFRRDFLRVRLFRKEIEFSIEGQIPRILNLGVVLGYHGSGVFAGSRVTSADDDLWTHGFIEASRNLANFLLLERDRRAAEGWYMERVYHFGKNGNLADQQVCAAVNVAWPRPVLQLCKEFKVDQPFYVWRCLFKDFIPWSEGPVTRFVY